MSRAMASCRRFRFASRASGKYRVLSGNHRVKSAIKAGLPKILVMFGTSDFDEQRQMAIQLSHNAISGQDDLAILKELYLSLKDLQLKAYSGINEAELMAYKAFDFAAISEQDIALNEINFMFSDANVKDVEKVLDALDKKGVDPEKDALVLGDVDRFIETMTRVKKRLNIKNRSVALLAMCRICEEYLTRPRVKSDKMRQIRHRKNSAREVGMASGWTEFKEGRCIEGNQGQRRDQAANMQAPELRTRYAG